MHTGSVRDAYIYLVESGGRKEDESRGYLIRGTGERMEEEESEPPGGERGF